MAWHQPGNIPLSEPMMVILQLHICITWPQWVKNLAAQKGLTNKTQRGSTLIHFRRWTYFPMYPVLPSLHRRRSCRADPPGHYNRPNRTTWTAKGWVRCVSAWLDGDPLIPAPEGKKTTMSHTYRKVSNIRRTKFQNLRVSRPVLQLSRPNLLKPCMKSRMKM